MKPVKYIIISMLLLFSLSGCQEKYDMIPPPDPNINQPEEVPEGQTLFKLISPVSISEARLVGSFSGSMQAWNTDHESGLMTEEEGSDGTVWRIYVNDTDYDDNLEFKFLCGPGWSYQATVDGQNMDNLSILAVKSGQIVEYEAEGWAEIYEPSEEEEEPEEKTFIVTVPEGTPADAYVSIAGNFPAGSEYAAWSPGAAVMTNNGDGTYTMALSVLSTFVYKYTVSADGVIWEWDYSETYPGDRAVTPATIIEDYISDWDNTPW